VKCIDEEVIKNDLIGSATLSINEVLSEETYTIIIEYKDEKAGELLV
jgi:hypothetical protein